MFVVLLCWCVGVVLTVCCVVVVLLSWLVLLCCCCVGVLYYDVGWFWLC